MWTCAPPRWIEVAQLEADHGDGLAETERAKYQHDAIDRDAPSSDSLAGHLHDCPGELFEILVDRQRRRQIDDVAERPDPDALGRPSGA